MVLKEYDDEEAQRGGDTKGENKKMPTFGKIKPAKQKQINT